VPAAAQEAAELGKRVFNQCRACHSVEAGGRNGVGPNLHAIVGRKAGTIEGFRYSANLKEKAEGGLVWDEATLRGYITNPKDLLPNGSMSYPGLKNPEQLDNLIAYLKTELFLVLGTSSSESALPSLMDKMERAGCAKPIVGLVIPTGYSFNLDGTNIYMTLAALFIAQATGVQLSLGDQLLLLGVAMISSKGAAGVTGAGFITLAATLSVMPSVPVAGMALILGIDRFMSECRAITNFIGNAVATIVVARWEGALDKDALDLALKG
jgi:cytochrome c2